MKNEQMKLEDLYNLMDKVNGILTNLTVEILYRNKKGQFDFCTHPKLADKADIMKKRTDKINQLIYQER